MTENVAVNSFLLTGHNYPPEKKKKSHRDGRSSIKSTLIVITGCCCCCRRCRRRFSTSLSLAGNLGPGKAQQPQEQRYLFISYQCVQYFHVQTMVWLPVPVFGIFNVRTDVQ